MTIHAFLLVTRPGIDHISVSQHGPPLVRNVENITVAFLALIIGEKGVCFLPLFVVIIFFLEEMDENVFGAMPGFGIEKLKCVLRGWKVAVHTVGHKTLLIINMTGGFPGIIGESDLVADGTELRCCCADHSVVGKAEEWKSNDYPNDNKNGRLDKLLHGSVPAAVI